MPHARLMVGQQDYFRGPIEESEHQQPLVG